MIPSRAAVAALLSLVVAPAYAGLIPGGGPAASDCYVEFEVQNVTGTGNTVTCQDGDPCDADAACDGTCTFQMRLCVNQCANSASVTLKKPKLKGARASLAFDTIKVSSAASCAPFTPVAVKTKKKGKAAGKGTVSVTAVSTGKPKRDTDKLTLVCTPRVGACPPPTTTSTTIVTATSSTSSTSTVPTTTSTSTTLSPDACPGLGLRIVSIGGDSHVYSSAFGGASIDLEFSGSVVLCAGPADAGGTSPLSVASDSYAGIKVTMGAGFLCSKVDAAGSSGSLSCGAGGAPVDVDYSLDSHQAGANDPPVIVTGATGAGTPGSAYLTASIRTVVCPSAPIANPPAACLALVTSTADCSDPTKVDFGQVEPTVLPISTGKLLAHVVNPKPPLLLGIPTIEKTGAAFDCANWRTEGSAGTLVIPFLLTDGVFVINGAPIAVGDVANIVVIDD